MKAIKIIQKLDNLGDIREKEFSRRDIFNKGLNFSLKTAMMAIPLGFLLKPETARADPSAGSVTDVLNFALTLEYLEAAYYQMGLSSGVVAAADKTVIQQISKHETAHVALLQATITKLGGTPVTSPEFDFTAGGTYDPFGDYPTFLVLANAFEDTGVRAYKGQAVNLMGSGDVLTAALNIHSVEARHASEIRRIRGLKGWITGKTSTGVPDGIYAAGNPAADFPAEDNITQGGVDVSTISMTSASLITESFDEPLDKASVLAIATPFLKM
jgi:hypothetical protein